MIVLLTGGSGCGKSSFAEKLISRMGEGERFYIATMQVYDDESRRRVARHRKQRAGLGFVTIECEKDLASVDIPEGSVVLLEDLVNLTANEMFDGGDVGRIIPALDGLAAKCRHLVMVTNDVFSDGESYAETTEGYLRSLARVNAHAAAISDYAAELVYSIEVPLKGALTWL